MLVNEIPGRVITELSEKITSINRMEILNQKEYNVFNMQNQPGSQIKPTNSSQKTTPEQSSEVSLSNEANATAALQRPQQRTRQPVQQQPQPQQPVQQQSQQTQPQQQPQPQSTTPLQQPEQTIEGGLVGAGHKMATRYGKFRLIKSILSLTVFAVILIIVWITAGLPWYIGLGVLAFLALLMVLSVVHYKRISTPLSDQGQSGQSAAATNISGDETLQLQIGGIMSSGGVRSTSFLGRGEVKDPQNALLVTNQAVYFIYVPVKGGDQMVNGTDIGMANWTFGQGQIQDKLDNMLNQQPLQEVVNSDARNIRVPRVDIKEVKFSNLQRKITVKTASDKHSYSVRKKDDLENIKKLLQ